LEPYGSDLPALYRLSERYRQKNTGGRIGSHLVLSTSTVTVLVCVETWRRRLRGLRSSQFDLRHPEPAATKTHAELYIHSI